MPRKRGRPKRQTDVVDMHLYVRRDAHKILIDYAARMDMSLAAAVSALIRAGAKELAR